MFNTIVNECRDTTNIVILLSVVIKTLAEISKNKNNKKKYVCLFILTGGYTNDHHIQPSDMHI